MNSSNIRTLLQKTALAAAIALPLGLAILAGYLLLPALEAWLGIWPGRLVVTFGLASLLIFVMNKVPTSAPNLLRRFIPTASFDPNRVLREFSLGISNINDPAVLATTAIGLICEAFDLEHGHLFEVDHETNPSHSTYRLTLAGGLGQIPEDKTVGDLNENSPIALFLRQEHNPISSQRLVHSKRFSAAQESERAWLAGLGADYFVPVHTKQEWIGLIVLGPKKAGGNYIPADLPLIGTLAGQLSLSLQNARLIASLMRVNNDFRRAYTSMEQSNRQLQQAINQLEKMDETKSDFISVASHELRTPLTVMRGYAEMLVEDPVILQSGTHLKMLKGIYSGILRMHEIVESMLDVASIDSRSLRLHKLPISINTTIHGITNGLKNTLQDRHLELEIESLRDLPAIDADSRALSKVFYHLLVNAIKYTPDGGRITIHGLPVSPGQAGLTDGGVEIIFSDTGIGIDSSHLDLIFHKFYQTGKVSLHSSGKTKFKGAGPGLGLAIAKGIIEAHGGRIWAESPGYDEETLPGSQFHVILPYH